MKISLFTNVKNTSPVREVTLDEALGYIQNNYDNVRYTIDLMRAEPDKAKRNELKKHLPAFTWSGTFSKRNVVSLISHSGIMCIDLDDVEGIKEVKKVFSTDPHTLACFVSPSGNGLKVLYKVELQGHTHADMFNDIAEYITNKYGVVVDASGKDVCRLCFLSHDPDVYINYDCEPYRIIDWEAYEAEIAVATGAEPASIPLGFADIISKCDQIARNTAQPARGTYNMYIINFARYACRYGLLEADTAEHLSNYCVEHNSKETRASVKSVYAKFAGEFNTWDHTKTNATRSNTQHKEQNASVVNPDRKETQFWYEVANEKTGKIEYKISYPKVIDFLTTHGFCKLSKDQMIQVNDSTKQVRIVDRGDVLDFFNSTFKEQKNNIKIVDLFMRSSKNCCSDNTLTFLEYRQPHFKKDTKEKSFVYFQNCYLEISAEGVTQKNYTELDGYIWSKQVIKFNYTPTAHSDCDFSRFAFLAMVGKNSPLDQCSETDLEKVNSFKSTIGYLLHRYKNPSLTKAVVAVDRQLRTHGENNGGTGKSLVSMALGQMLNVCLIDGQLFGFDKPFPFQKANVDTELINFNDIKKNFDFQSLYGMITEEFTFEKKGKDSVTIDFHKSPKFYISTNSTLKGNGTSVKRRQQIIEFSPYFNEENTPVKEFGKMFFIDWDTNEYAMFYSYMVHCLQYYLQYGLQDFPLENYEINKLIDTAGEEFIDYMEYHVLKALPGKSEHELHTLYQTFIKEHKSRENTQIKTFNKNVKSWADINGLLINAHKNGERDKRNNITYLTFTHANPANAVAATDPDLPF